MHTFRHLSGYNGICGMSVCLGCICSFRMNDQFVWLVVTKVGNYHVASYQFVKCMFMLLCFYFVFCFFDTR